MGNIVLSKLLFILLLIILYYVVVKSILYLLPFILGWIISIIIEPIVSFLHKKLRIYRGLSSFLAVIFFIAASGLIIFFLGGLLVTELTKLSDRLPQLSEQIGSYVSYISLKFQSFYITIPSNITKSLSNSLYNLLNNITNYIGLAVASTLNIITAIPSILIFILVTLIAAFFISKDKQKINNFLKAQIPVELLRNEKIKVLKDDLFFALFGYIKAQLILMSITFTISAVGLTIIGINYSVLIALLISVVDALPILGSGSIYMPWIIFNLIFKDFNRALFLTILYLVVTLVRQTLEPKILSTQIGLYPLVTLISMYVGLQLFGFAGLILGPIIVITLIALQKTGIIPNWKSSNNKK